MTHKDAELRRARMKALQLVTCDACGKPTAVEAMTVEGRYAFCPTCLPVVREFERRERRERAHDRLYDDVCRETVREVEAEEGAYTVSARAVRRYREME